MSNILDDEKQQQILGLGRLGWSLRRIERATGVRRETASAYLKAADIPVRGRGRPGAGPPKPAINGEVSTDLGACCTPSPQPSLVFLEPAKTVAQLSEEVVREFVPVLSEYSDEQKPAKNNRTQTALLSVRVSRGRNAGHPAPPAQIPACGITAPGSYLGS